MKTRMAVILLCMPVLAGCEGTGTTTAGATQGEGIPQVLYDGAFSAGVARELAQACPGLSYDAAEEDKALQELTVLLRGKGYTEARLREMAENLPRSLVTRDAKAYVADNDINVLDTASVCAAGQREIAAGTEIGRFLNGAG